MKPDTDDSASISPIAASSLMGACFSCSGVMAPVLQTQHLGLMMVLRVCAQACAAAAACQQLPKVISISTP